MRGAARIARLFGVRRPLVLPTEAGSVPAADPDSYSPHLRFATAEHEMSRLIADYARRNTRGKFLDVGGGNGTGSVHLAGAYEHIVLDLAPSAANTITADICHCPEVPEEAFDIVYSNNTYEHIERPWLAAAETARILKPDGLALVVTCFAWRYHPVPGDYFRFSHSALESMFAAAGMETVSAGYDLRFRRDDRRGGKLEGNLDAVPVDELGGWRENWLVFYAGRKR